MAVSIPDYDTDYIKLHWRIEALKGQVRELERERNRNQNFLWAVRFVLMTTLSNLGIDADFDKLSDNDLLALFEHTTLTDPRFSQCPNAAELHCRPLAMRKTSDGDLVSCADCGWSLLE